MNNDISLAWRNIWRNPRRTVLTVSAIAFAALLLVFMLSFQFGTYETMINTSVSLRTGHLQVQAAGYLEDREVRLAFAWDDAMEEALFKGDPRIEAVAPRANGFALVTSGSRTYGCMVTGVDPEREKGVSTLAAIIRKGRYFSGEDRALVGETLARNLKVGVGDELTLLGQGRDGSVAASVVTVGGIFGSGLDEYDRNVVLLPLSLFQDVFSMGREVHEVAIRARSLSDVRPLKSELSDKLASMPFDGPAPVALDWMDLVPGLLQSIQMDLVSGIIMYLILIIVVAFSILNTFVMAIFERTREFGVMMAIGTTPGRLMRLVLTESFFMTATGLALGIAFGAALTLWFESHGILIPGGDELMKAYGITGRLYPKLSLLSATIGPSAVLVITLFSALFPALKLRQMKPVEAMHHV
ncbi:transporter [Desulfoluna limicola]|uniref:Transporter n=1 Tax=Desulfoluna limicola TaxID=2810562 RepID=A0ABN6F754_9BACT|nr:ABC transporter permease [Desulfoluna limicola]BCS98183.1 transporter [Desulfoluna limicola]